LRKITNWDSCVAITISKIMGSTNWAGVCIRGEGWGDKGRGHEG